MNTGYFIKISAEIISQNFYIKTNDNFEQVYAHMWLLGKW